MGWCGGDEKFSFHLAPIHHFWSVGREKVSLRDKKKPFVYTQCVVRRRHSSHCSILVFFHHCKLAPLEMLYFQFLHRAADKTKVLYFWCDKFENDKFESDKFA